MKILKIEFVEFIPEGLEDGILYISMKYKTARHKCACGCGNIVIMPITPNDWQLKYNGKSVTFNPSVGNWNFDCRSHYWIIENEIRWAEDWDGRKIENGRKLEYKRNSEFFEKEQIENALKVVPSKVLESKSKNVWWRLLLNVFRI